MPEIKLQAKINKYNNVQLFYNVEQAFPDLDQLHAQFMVLDYRALRRGLPDIAATRQETYSFTYSLGNLLEGYLLNCSFAFLQRSPEYDFLQNISESVFASTVIPIAAKKLFFANIQYDQLLPAISSNLKFSFNYDISDSQNEANDTGLRNIRNIGQSYGFQYASFFKFWLNTRIGLKYYRNSSNVQATNFFAQNKNDIYSGFVDVVCDLPKSIKLVSTLEYWTIDNEAYYFVDVDMRRAISDKLTISLIGKNLLNYQNFRQVYVSDVGISARSLRMLPAFLMLQMSYNF